MKNKLNRVLLIDDDKITNTLNEMVIKKSGYAERIESVQNGIEALEYLMKDQGEGYPRPDLMFLDINMPGMDGWEFIEEYSKLDKRYQGNLIVVMLTTSLNPDDKDRSDDSNQLNDFINKPLTTEKFQKIMEKNFPDIVGS